MAALVLLDYTNLNVNMLPRLHVDQKQKVCSFKPLYRKSGVNEPAQDMSWCISDRPQKYQKACYHFEVRPD